MLPHQLLAMMTIRLVCALKVMISVHLENISSLIPLIHKPGPLNSIVGIQSWLYHEGRQCAFESLVAAVAY